MDNQKEFNDLIKKFGTGAISPEELDKLEQAIEKGLIDLQEITSLHDLHEKLDQITVPEPGVSMQERFYESLQKEMQRPARKDLLEGLQIWLIGMGWSINSLRWAYTIFLMVIGTGVGLILSPPKNNQQIDQLSSEVQEMKEMMLLTLLEEQSATQRLKAVSLSQDLQKVDEKVINALVETLKFDENVNVRLVTIDALINYADNPLARQGLVEAIAYQHSAMVQVTLADAMVILKEKGSVQELKELLKNEELDEGVKEKINESINQLI